MYTAQPFSSVRRWAKAGRLAWGFPVLILMLGLSCSTAHPQREALSEYYWDVQNLRMQVGQVSRSAQAGRDLGVIYLRTGHFEEAYDVLTQALAQDRSDPKLWFYAGLAQEMLDRQEDALATYERSPLLSVPSVYSRAMKGRMAWLQDAKRRRTFDALLTQESVPPLDSLSPDTYAVFPFICQGVGDAYAVLGTGWSDVISRDLVQLLSLDVVDSGAVRTALERASALPERTDMPRLVWVGRVLGAGKVVGGTCTLSENRIAIDLVFRDLLDEQVIAVSAEERLQDVSLLEKKLMDNLVNALRIWLPNRERRIQATPLNLEVLLAYGQGLEQEASGQLARSAVSYRQALALYPRFTLAEVRSEAVDNKMLAQGVDQKDLVDLLLRLEAYEATPYLLDTRLQHLEGHLPGQTRTLPPGNVGELPTPPRPTGN